MLQEHEKNKAVTAIYKLDSFKDYRKQLGLNLIRNRDLAQESNKRSVNFTLKGSTSPRKQYQQQ